MRVILDVIAVVALSLFYLETACSHGTLIRDSAGQVVGEVESYSTTSNGQVAARSIKGVRFVLDLNTGRVDYNTSYYGCVINGTAGTYHESPDCSGQPFINRNGISTRCAGQAFKFVASEQIYFIPRNVVPQVRAFQSYRNLGSGVCSAWTDSPSISLDFVENDPAVTGIVAFFPAPLSLEFNESSECVFGSGYEVCQ